MNEQKHLISVISVKEIKELFIGIEKAVRRSSVMRPQLIYTEGPISRDEFERRSKWCVKKTLELKKTKRWPVERIVDWLPNALIDWLDGKEPLVSDANAWIGGA